MTNISDEELEKKTDVLSQYENDFDSHFEAVPGNKNNAE